MLVPSEVSSYWKTSQDTSDGRFRALFVSKRCRGQGLLGDMGSETFPLFPLSSLHILKTRYFVCTRPFSSFYFQSGYYSLTSSFTNPEEMEKHIEEFQFSLFSIHLMRVFMFRAPMDAVNLFHTQVLHLLSFEMLDARVKLIHETLWWPTRWYRIRTVCSGIVRERVVRGSFFRHTPK